MNRIHLLPIEPFEKRYTADWRRWWPDALRQFGYDVTVWDGEIIPPVDACTFDKPFGTKNGEFLDGVGTHYYKATQMAALCKGIRDGRVSDGDIVLLLDGWNPAVTSLAYIRSVCGIKYKIAAVLHAGTWDAHDHLTRCGMRDWASHVEYSWLESFDMVLVATGFHKKLIEGAMNKEMATIRVTGLPLMLEELNTYKKDWKQKKYQVVFPHRTAPEKSPQRFDAIKEKYQNTYAKEEQPTWVMTEGVATSKETYYQILADSKVAVSCALQETWGIAQLEAWYLGAAPVVPYRLSYPEIYPEENLYLIYDHAAVELIHRRLRGPAVEFKPLIDPREAFGTICEELRCIS